jgi:CBS-domain-containing membrane protein
MYFKKETFKIKISDIIEEIKNNKAPVVREDTPIEKVLEEVIIQDSNRVLYVVDDENHLKGTITLNEVARQIFSMSHEHRVHSRRIMDMVTAEDVGHIMKKRPPYALDSDDIGEIVKKMVKSNMKHLALVDENKKIICDLSMVDIIKYMVEADKK